MARVIVTNLVDDLDGSTAEETVQFSFEDVNYEIDLSRKNAQRFRDSLSGYIEAGRRASNGRGGGRGRRGGQSAPVDARSVRLWAAENQIEVSARGRVSREVIDQYLAAHH